MNRVKNTAKKMLGPVGLYSPLQNAWQRIGERRIEKKILLAHSQSAAMPNPAYLNAGKELYENARSGKPIQSSILKIPNEITSLKIDVGLSYTAPNSALWIRHNPGVFVFGFEPNREALDYLLYKKIGRKSQRTPIASSLRKIGGLDVASCLGKNCMLFDVALDDSQPSMKSFYMTKGVGTSSFYKPSYYKVKELTEVPSVRLSDLLALIPWERFAYIEQIKVDTQGNDLNVLRSAGTYLKKIVFVTAEIPLPHEYEKQHNEQELDAFMKENGFELIMGTSSRGNKTYGNNLFKNLWNEIDYKTIES